MVDATAELAQVIVPISSIRASRDRLVPRSAGALIRRAGRQVEETEIEGPHMLLQTRAEVASARIIAFIQGLQSTLSRQTDNKAIQKS